MVKVGSLVGVIQSFYDMNFTIVHKNDTGIVVASTSNSIRAFVRGKFVNGRCEFFKLLKSV